jgi:flagellar secretion chaperone FliS
MSMNPDNFGRRDSVTTSEQYLEASIRTASPARLRLMLLDRAVEVAHHIATNWRNKQQLGTNEHTLRLLDILNELLNGVVGAPNPGEQAVCKKVADLYVFLTKHLLTAEQRSDADAMNEIKTVLQVEAETWRAVCAKESPARPRTTSSAPISGSLNLLG